MVQQVVENAYKFILIVSRLPIMFTNLQFFGGFIRAPSTDLQSCFYVTRPFLPFLLHERGAMPKQDQQRHCSCLSNVVDGINETALHTKECVVKPS